MTRKRATITVHDLPVRAAVLDAERIASVFGGCGGEGERCSKTEGDCCPPYTCSGGSDLGPYYCAGAGSAGAFM